MTSAPAVSDVKEISRLASEVVAAHPPREVSVIELMGAWYDAGLSWVHFPVGMGGLDAPRNLQLVANRILRDAGGPDPRSVNTIGYGIVAGTILRFATPDMAKAWLRPLATGEEIWCQLFSEPGAGSDLAGLATRAVPEGDGWRVNGQKVWTSLAHKAKWAVLLARTDADVPKHQGLSYFVVDMQSEGVQVVPLRQITGRATFNEVFLDDVFIPNSHLVGEAGAGWKIANSTLTDERTSLGDRVAARGSGAIADALDLWARYPDRRTPVMRERLARLWTRSECHRLTGIRGRVATATGGDGPSASISKLVGSELTQAVYEFCIDLLGPEAAIIDTYSIDAPDDECGPTAIQRKYLRSRATTIEGGTSEINRNVIAERVLKLPQGLRNDKGVSWRDIPR